MHSNQQTKQDWQKEDPLLKCSYSSPFAIDEAGYRTSTKAYNIQCWCQDAKTMIKYIRTANIKCTHLCLSQTVTPRFQCLPQLDQKTKLIPIELLHYSDQRSITRNNVYLETQLLQIDGITEVLEHKQTDGTAS